MPELANLDSEYPCWYNLQWSVHCTYVWAFRWVGLTRDIVSLRYSVIHGTGGLAYMHWWHKKLWERMEIFPHGGALSSSVEETQYPFPNFTSQHTLRSVTWRFLSTLQEALGGLTAKHLSEVGPISTQLPKVPTEGNGARNATRYAG